MSLKSTIAHLPLIGSPLQRWWQTRYNRLREQRMGLPELQRAFIAAHGLQVQSGPFAGLRYVSDAVGSTYIPKLLGSYEAELHPALSDLIAQRPPRVIDVGCAEGYYAVGLARALPASTVYAFDIDPRGRRLCARMASLNSTRNIELHSRCDPAGLRRLLVPGALLVCDCEGYEYTLLDSAAVPQLAHATLLVELHPWLNPGAAPTFLAQFDHTHALTLIDSRERDADAYPALTCLPADRRDLAVSEMRHGRQQWALLCAK